MEKRRKGLQISRESLSFQTKISEKTLYNYEKDHGSPTVNDLQKIATVLKVEPAYFLGGKYNFKLDADENEIAEEICSLRFRKDLQNDGALRIVLKVMQTILLGGSKLHRKR